MQAVAHSHRTVLRRPEPEARGCSRVAVEIGGLSVGISSQDVPLALERVILPFRADRSHCHLEVEAAWADELSVPCAPPLFTSGGLWTAFQENGGTAFCFRSSYLGNSPYKTAWFNPDFTSGKVLLFRPYFDSEQPVYALEYPLDELLTIHRLAQSGTGAEVHACGVSNGNGGTLFVGHSGAGKSTTSRLWSARPNTLVLSDDRIILRERGGEVHMYGTPWHGDAGIAAPASCKLDRIFIVEHGLKNELIPLAAASATAELFTRIFVPHYDRSAIEKTLRFVEKVVAGVPVSRFRFVPDATAVEAILRAA